MKTQAAILVESKAPLEIADIEIPSLSFGQVLVRVHYSGICGSQLGEIDAVKGPDPYLPHLLGHEGSGVVQQVGPGVSRVQAGDHVVLHWRKASGIEAEPACYRLGEKVVNAGWVTTFNQQAVISENRLTPIPQNFPLDLAVLYGCALTTGFGVIEHDAKVKLGESVLILGCGGIGLCSVLAASLRGAYPIVALDLVDEKLELAKAYGASHQLNLQGLASEEMKQKLLSIVAGQGFDAVIENTGQPELIETCYELTAAQGSCVLVGIQPKGTKVRLDTMPLHFDKRLVGSHGGKCVPDLDIPRYIKLQNAGFFDPQALVRQRFKLEEVNEAIAGMRSGQAFRPLLCMAPSEGQ